MFYVVFCTFRFSYFNPNRVSRHLTKYNFSNFRPVNHPVTAGYSKYINVFDALVPCSNGTPSKRLLGISSLVVPVSKAVSLLESAPTLPKISKENILKESWYIHMVRRY